MVARSEFREDLLYRVNTVEICLPPLRERAGDVPLLAQYYLDVYARKYQRTGLSIAGTTLTKLERNPWPGNVRELQHAMERAVIMAAEPVSAAVRFPPFSPAAASGRGPHVGDVQPRCRGKLLDPQGPGETQWQCHPRGKGARADARGTVQKAGKTWSLGTFALTLPSESSSFHSQLPSRAGFSRARHSISPLPSLRSASSSRLSSDHSICREDE